MDEAAVIKTRQVGARPHTRSARMRAMSFDSAARRAGVQVAPLRVGCSSVTGSGALPQASARGSTDGMAPCHRTKAISQRTPLRPRACRLCCSHRRISLNVWRPHAAASEPRRAGTSGDPFRSTAMKTRPRPIAPTAMRKRLVVLPEPAGTRFGHPSDLKRRKPRSTAVSRMGRPGFEPDDGLSVRWSNLLAPPAPRRQGRRPTEPFHRLAQLKNGDGPRLRRPRRGVSGCPSPVGSRPLFQPQEQP